MPCCAFAAFIVGQIFLGFDAVKRFVFGDSLSAEVSDNPATEWRLTGGASPSAIHKTNSRRGPTARWFAVAAIIEMALLFGGAYGVRSHFQHHAIVHHSAKVSHRG
jgi:hypothetical protein